MPRPVTLAGDSGFSVEIDGDEFRSNTGSAVLSFESDDRLTPTFEDPEPTTAVFTITALSTTASGSLYRMLDERAGEIGRASCRERVSCCV